jgi:Domain of unknown function (DUF4262)
VTGYRTQDPTPAPGANPMLESTEVRIMRHDEIKTPGYYIVSTDRPGRGLRQLDAVHIVEVKQVRDRPGPGSHEARFERMGVVERTEGVVPVEQVLQHITDPRKIEKLEAARALAGTWADGPVMHAERWAHLSAAMDALHERGGVDESIDRAYTITLTPPDARAAIERWQQRLAGIEAGTEPATGDSARMALRALREAELRVHRRATGHPSEACEIAFGLVQARRPEGEGYHDDAWADAAALAEHLPDDGLRLDLPDGAALVVEILTAHDVRIAWSDLPGAPFAHLAEYIRAFEFMHEPDGRVLDVDDQEPPASDRPFGLEDTPVSNPLTNAVRRRVARWLNLHADEFARGLAAGPDPAELAELQVDTAEWARRGQDATEHLRGLAEAITSDELPFSVAGAVRNLLDHAEQHELTGACAALHATLSAALPQRMHACDREIERMIAKHGFFIQVVGGQEEPLALPGFAYTRGLGENASHPELVMVGMPQHLVSFVLADLSTQILAGRRTLRPGDVIDDVLADGYTLRVSECPRHLTDQTRQDPEKPAGALQILLPDKAGRFPGDPGVDPHYAHAQRYPEHPA